MLDTIHYLGGDVKRVYAMSRRVSGLLDVDDVTTILFELESGAGAYLATLMAVPNVTTVAAFGTEGAAWSEADGSHAFIQKRGEPYRTEVPVTTIDTIHDEIVEFAHCIRTGDEPETGAKEGLAVMEVFEALVRSIEEDAPVDVR
jgi:predicted dehydrogenase